MMVRTRQSFAFLGDVVHEVRKGRLAPAAFQRPYVWSRDDVEELWASIVSRDPLGGLLLWEPEDEETVSRMGRSHLGPIVRGSDRHSALILDGQNRLVTLAWSMVDPATVAGGLSGSDVWQTNDDLVLVADPRGRRPCIRFMPREELGGMAMPVWKLFDNGMFNAHLRQTWDGEGVEGEIAADWLTSVQQGIREARVVVSTIEGGNAEQAKRRFVRMARVGVPMSAEDFDAIMSAK